MRKFTEEENKWIEYFVEQKEKGISHIQELQVAKILRTEFSFFALKWTYGNKPKISLYNKVEDKDKVEQQYYNICDFIYFVKELESLGFIAMQKISSEKEDSEFSVLYDREKYKYDENEDKFKSNGCLEEYEDLGNGIAIKLQIDHTQNINLDFAYDLQKYGLGIIYPLPLAKDYVSNNFKTLEERYHDEEMKVALDSAEESRMATIIAFISLILSIVFGLYEACTPQEIEPEQINAIETTIRNNYIEEPLEVEIKDTILTKPIEKNNQTVSFHQPINHQQK